MVYVRRAQTNITAIRSTFVGETSTAVERVSLAVSLGVAESDSEREDGVVVWDCAALHLGADAMFVMGWPAFEAAWGHGR